MSLNIQPKFNLSQIVRFGIGGEADFFVRVTNIDELKQALDFAHQKNLQTSIIGEGTNLLVADDGFRGLIIQIAFTGIEWDADKLTAKIGAGENLLDFIAQACAKGWAGMENMYGIPGNIGGGIYGNVGAYGTEMRSVLVSVSFWDGTLVRKFSNAECEFEYRTSIFKQYKNWVILEAELQFQKGDDVSLVSRCQEVIAVRLVKYPDGLKCPGSYFKNVRLADLKQPQQDAVKQYADKVKGGKLASGLLLEAAGCKGLAVADARVADYHANLIFNAGLAKAEDVKNLATQMKQRVQDKFGIELEEEVQFL